MKTVHAIYEHGIFRPLESVALPEKSEVEFEPRPVLPAAGTAASLQAIYGILSERYASGDRATAARHDEQVAPTSTEELYGSLKSTKPRPTPAQLEGLRARQARRKYGV